MMNKENISCSKVIPLTGILSPSPQLSEIHKTAKLAVPELSEHRISLNNLVSRLGIPDIQKNILENPKLNSKILSEIANNFFTSSYSQKAEDLVRTMSMPNYDFSENKISNELNTPKEQSIELNEIQKSIINEINKIQPKWQDARTQSEPKKENSNSQEFGNFF